MVEASFMGKSGSLKIDKGQEKTLIYLVAAVVLFIIGYTLYKSVQTVETVSKTASSLFQPVSGTAIKTVEAITGGVNTVVEVAQNVYAAPQIMYNESTAAIEQSIGAPVGSYDKYLDSMGILSMPLKIASTLTPDSIEAVAAQAGQTVRSWFDSIF